MMEKIENNEMETGNLKKLSIKMAIPMVISMLSLALYNLVDSIFVSNIGTEALTAISLSFPIQSLIIAVGLGTGIGVNSLIARKLGEKKEDLVQNIILHGIFLVLFSYIIIAIIGGTLTTSIIKIFTKNELILKYGKQYLSIYMIFSFGILYQILFEKISEAIGKPVYSMLIQFSGAVINLVLDPILIYGLYKIPALGIHGAIIATVFGQICGMVLGIILLKRKGIKFNLKQIKFEIEIIKEIYIVGLPSIVTESIAAFVTLFLNRVLIYYSEFAVPFLGIYIKVQSLIFMIVYGFNYGMIPIVGYNFGAKKYDRMKDCIKIFIVYVEIIMLLGIIIFMLLGKNIFNIYGAEQGIIDIGIVGFRVLCLGFIFAGVSLVFSSVFQAIGKGKYSLMIYLLRQLIINIPVIFLLRYSVSINYIWNIFVLSEIVAMIFSYLVYKYEMKKLDMGSSI